MIATGVLNLFGQVIGLMGKKGAAKQEAVAKFAGNMQRTWVDEILVVYWFAPSFFDWFGWAAPLVSQTAMIAEGGFLFQAQIGISAAAFGLNKLAGKK